MRKIHIKAWDRYWMLVVLYEIEWVKSRRVLCKCDCWKEKEVNLSHLRSWKIISCRCFQSKMVSDNFKKHWLSHTRCERIYRDLYRRCNAPKIKQFHDYWWRWIKCKWKSTSEFLDDMYESYLAHVEIHWEINTTIDRIDSNWNYTKDNCRWATRLEQWSNTRRNRYMTIDWERLHLMEVSRRINVNESKLRYYLNKWLSDEEVIKKVTHKRVPG